MNYILASIFFFLALFSDSHIDHENQTEDLVGIWMVDLRPTPESEAYYQEMVIELVDGNEITGSFYGTKIEESHINTDWGALRFAFKTDGGDTQYHTMGTLKDGKIEGMTHAIGRGFLSYWTAERKFESNN